MKRTHNATNPQDDYRTPPQNTEAEESLISAVILDNNMLLNCIDIVQYSDFYPPSHRIIWKAIVELFQENQPVDIVTLATKLSDKEKLDSISGHGYQGATYLAWITEAAPVALNAPHYAQIVKNKSKLRKLIQAGYNISQRCYELQEDPEQAIAYAEKSIFDISLDNDKKTGFSIKNIVDSNYDRLEEILRNQGVTPGIPTGFQKIDKLTGGLQNSDLIVLAARPSMGKTAFALNIARNAAYIGCASVGVFSLEMSKEQLGNRLIAAEAEVNLQKFKTGNFGSDEWASIQESCDTLGKLDIHIDDSPDLTPIELRAKCLRLKMEKDLGLVIIDYLQLMRGNGNYNGNSVDEITDISRSLKILAKELDIPVIVLSQLNRKLEERADKHPIPSDLRGSGSIEQDADVIAFIYRHEVYNKGQKEGIAEIYISKHRNGPLGGDECEFKHAYAKFDNIVPMKNNGYYQYPKDDYGDDV